MAFYDKMMVVLYKSKQKKGAKKMKYEVKAVGRNVEVKANERMPDGVFKELQLIARVSSAEGTCNALRTEFKVTCKTIASQKTVLNKYANLLLADNWM